MTSYVLSSANPAKSRADVVVVGVVSGKRPKVTAAAVSEAYGRKLAPLLASLGVTGKAGESTLVPTSGTLSAPLMLLVGLGAEADVAAVRRAAGVAARGVPNAATVALALPADTPELVRAVTEGFHLGGYSFTRYKSGSKKDTGPNDVIVLSAAARQTEAQTAFADAQVVATEVRRTRDWVNTPPNDLRPPSFAEEIEAAVKAANKALPRGATKVKVAVSDEAALAELNCGGLLGVGSASDAPPRLVELTYAPKGATQHLALVGKGITYDSGGLTIKPATGMVTMKYDMAGAAAVVSATLAIAALQLPIKVTTFAALAENMIGESALRPGDVLTFHNGTTAEITNTDAEGRLVLADALSIAVERQPDLIVDVATLTGHMQLALGNQVSGVLGSDDVVAEVVAAGAAVDETHWPMPIPDAIVERVHSSTIADLCQHDWIRWGGGLFAAAFLREFTGEVPWAHLDIAGPGFLTGGPQGHVTAGGTGFTVATLVEFARGRSA